MAYVYSDNGSSFRAVYADYAVQPGEVIFQEYALETDLVQAFPARAAITVKEATNAPILAQIAALEDQVTQRRLREALLGADGGWLASVNMQIAGLRASLVK